MSLAGLSGYLFVLGAISLLISFVLHVAHTTLLASGWHGATSAAVAAAPAAGSVPPGGLGRSALGGGTTAGSIGHTFAWLSLALLALAMGARAAVVMRGPWGNMFEFSLAFAAGILAGYLFLARRHQIRQTGFLPLGLALFLAGYGLTLPATVEPLVPALDNAPLLTVHVAMAMLSYGIFATSFGAAVAYLAQGRGDRFAWLPSHRVLDQVAYRAVIIGFPIFASMIILGSWWASIAWGRYWGWDPKETSALVTWLIYALYLHTRTLRGWSGRPSALILVIGFGAVLFTYFGNLFFSGLHAYSGL